jgi:hypothetical protein
MGCQGLYRATHRIGTNGMPQPSLRMEIQRIKIEFVTLNTLKSQPEMSIHETMDQSKILFDETTQQLNIRIHEQLAF